MMPANGNPVSRNGDHDNNCGQFVSKNKITIRDRYVNRNFANNVDRDTLILQILNLTPSEKQFLNLLIGLSNNHQTVQIAIKTLALRISCNEKTVRRAIDELVRLKLLRVYKLGGPNIYILADELRDTYLRDQLKQVLSAFCYMPTHGLIFSERKCPPYYKNIIYIQDQNCLVDENRGDGDSGLRCALTQNKNYTHKGDTMTTVDSYIAPYVEKISSISLSFGEKYRLSQYPEAIIERALWIMSKNKNASYTYNYFDAICRRLRGNSTGSLVKSKQKFRLESNEEGRLHAIDLEIEAQEKEILTFGAAYNLVAMHTSGSALVDYNIRHFMGIRTSRKQAEEELVNLVAQGHDVIQFMKEIEEINAWDPIMSVEEIDDLIEEYELEQEWQESWEGQESMKLQQREELAASISKKKELSVDISTDLGEYSTITESSEFEIDESQYESVNTHMLFD
jgi:hypothetical protein